MKTETKKHLVSVLMNTDRKQYEAQFSQLRSQYPKRSLAELESFMEETCEAIVDTVFEKGGGFAVFSDRVDILMAE